MEDMKEFMAVIGGAPERPRREPHGDEYDGSDKHMQKEPEGETDWKELARSLVKVVDPSCECDDMSDEDLIAVIEKLTEGTIKKDAWDKLGDVDTDMKDERDERKSFGDKPKGKSKGFKGASDRMMKEAEKEDDKFDKEAEDEEEK